jgi:hypothetical protein
LELNTWTNDTNGIYDYSTDAIKTVKASISEPTYIVRTKNNSFKNISQHADIEGEKGNELIFYVNNGSKNKFVLINPIPYHLKLTQENISYLHNKMWYVLKSDELDEKIKIDNEDYYLNQNDIIKLGRVKYAIQELHIESKEISNGAPPSAIIENKYDIYKLNQNLEPVFDFVYVIKEKEPLQNETPEGQECRLCKDKKMNINKETDDGESNPLICVCKCKDNKYHYKCLKNYIKDNEIKVINQESIIDDAKVLKNFECDECKQQFPLKFKYENSDKIYNLYDYEVPSQGDYIILESLDCKESEAYIKYIHIIKLLKEYIYIGREIDNDVNNKGISISRKHAVMRYDKENGRVSLQNLSKKYGTLVLVRKPIKVLHKFIYLQNGRTFIGACLKDKEELKQNENMNKINE